MATETEFDIWVDFMSMSNDGRLWTRITDVRPGVVPIAGRYVTIGCEDADLAVARIITVDIERGIEVDVLDGDVEQHRHLLATE